MSRVIRFALAIEPDMWYNSNHQMKDETKTYKAPGRYYRKGMTIIELFELFPSDEIAEKWFVETRWADGIRCAHCDGDRITVRGNHPTMPYRCRECRKYFSVKTNAVMHSSKVGYQKWAITIYMFATSLKGVSSMKLAREIGVTQKTAWHMLHRLREAFEEGELPEFGGIVEADEMNYGGSVTNMRHADRKKFREKHGAARGVAGKTPIAGVKSRETGKVSASVVSNADKSTLQAFVVERTSEGATIHTDDARAYVGIPRQHESVNHGIGEYVRDEVTTNGIESFWATMRRGLMGTYHRMSIKHLDRYVTEFAGRHNIRSMDTIGQMQSIAKGMESKRLRRDDLFAD